MLSDSFSHRAMTAAGAAAMAEPFKSVGLHHALMAIPALCLVLARVLYLASRKVVRDMAQLRRLRDLPAVETGAGAA
jgi:hypothetical protein